jgi:hypothetical protein
MVAVLGIIGGKISTSNFSGMNSDFAVSWNFSIVVSVVVAVIGFSAAFSIL